MEPSAVALLIAKAVLPKVVGAATAPLVDRAKKQFFGDADERAFALAIDRADAVARREHPHVFPAHDVNLDAFSHEAANDLALFLQRRRPSALSLAETLIDGLSPDLESDERWRRIDDLWGACDVFLRTLDEGLRTYLPFLDRLAEPSTELDASRKEYLRWVTQQFRYVGTTGLGTTAFLDLPLSDIYVSIEARRRTRRNMLDDERRRAELADLDARLAVGDLSAEEREAAIDRLGLGGIDPTESSSSRLAGQTASPVAAIHESTRVVLLGDPGSGKTTLLRYLCLNHARAMAGDRSAAQVLQRPPLFPIYVAAGNFARWEDRKDGLRAYLADPENVPNCPAEDLATIIGAELRIGRCLVLIDGLDEVGSADQRAAIVDAIVAFTAAVAEQGNHVVVTSRPTGYDSAALPDAFREYVMLDMDDDAIDRFLNCYLPLAIAAGAEKSRSQVQAEAATARAQLMQAFAENRGVRRLAANPLLLTALVLVHIRTGQLPASRVGAYMAIETAMTRTWRARKVPGGERPDPDLTVRWLRRLAPWMTEHRPERAASWRDLLEVLGPLWCDDNDVTWDPSTPKRADYLTCPTMLGVRDFVLRIAQHTGLLVERAPQRWGFPHVTFQEYYTALGLLQAGMSADRPAALRARLHDPTYRETLLLALAVLFKDDAGSDSEKAQLFEAIVLGSGPLAEAGGLSPSPYEEVVGRDYLFALRALADDMPLKRSLADRLLASAIDELITRTGRGRFSRYRNALVDSLRALKPTRHHGPLLERISGLDVARVESASVIELARASVVLPNVLVTALESIVTNPDSNPYIASQAAQALGSTGNLTIDTIATLERIVATHDTNPTAALGAMQALASDGNLTIDTIAALERIVANPDTNPSFAFDAVQALASASDVTADGIAELERIVATHDTNPTAALGAAQALASTGNLTTDTIATLERIATKPDTDSTAALGAAQVLAFASSLTTDTTTTTAVERIVANPDTDPTAALGAAKVLASAGRLSADTIAAVERIVANPDTDPTAALGAAQALASTGKLSTDTIAALERIVANPDTKPTAASGAAQVLASTDNLTTDTIAALERIATKPDTHSYIARRAAQVLASTGNLTTDTIAALERIATNPDTEPSGASEAVRSLAYTGNPDAIAALERIATNPETKPSAASEAGRVLASAGNLSTDTIAALERIATNPDTEPSAAIGAGRVLASVGNLTTDIVAVLGRIATNPETKPSAAIGAGRVLASAGNLTTDTIAALERIATNPDTEPSAAIGAGRVLASAGNLTTDTIAVLGRIATNPETKPSAASEAVRVLASAGNLTNDTIAVLERIATNPPTDPSAASEAAQALASTENLTTDTIAALERFVTNPDSDGESRRRVIDRLTIAPWSLAIARSCLVDRGNDVRRSSVELLKRAVERGDLTMDELVLWLSDPALVTPDTIEHRSGWEYLYDGVWDLVVSPRRRAV